jgi:hypothetical protein
MALFSYVGAFNTMLTEVEALASQHEVVGDRFREELVPTLVQKCQGWVLFFNL